MSTPEQKPGGTGPVVDRENANPMAVVGLSIAVVALTASWLPWVGLVVAILAVILSVLGLKGAQRTGTGRGLAVTGLVIGVVSIAISGSATACAALSGPDLAPQDEQEALQPVERSEPGP